MLPWRRTGGISVFFEQAPPGAREFYEKLLVMGRSRPLCQPHTILRTLAEMVLQDGVLLKRTLQGQFIVCGKVPRRILSYSKRPLVGSIHAFPHLLSRAKKELA